MTSTSDRLTKGTLPRVQWGAVFTGVLCSMAAEIVLGLFGIAFGFAAAPSAQGLAILAGIWGIVVPIATSFVGAFIAVRVAGERLESGALVHGALVWCIVLIASAAFLTGAIGSAALTARNAASEGSAASPLLERDPMTGRIQVLHQGDDAARRAAAGTGAAGVSALLGLGGALFGAAAGWSMVSGEGFRRRRGSSRRKEPGQAEREGLSYADRESLMASEDMATRRQDEPPGAHH